ncbi:MAG: vWA domain-containing protein [Planctomycetota bacterium]|jgi:hypothetical protein
MKNDYTHISIILDRTGSMSSIRDDTIGGFNTFLKDQKKEPGIATITLVQFDSVDPYEIIHKFKPIKDVPELTHKTYVPRAMTPLLDAMGRGINDIEKSLTDLSEEERPSKVVVVVITDGQENASQEFRKDQIVKMARKKTKKDDWQFVFLSADLDAFMDAGRMGVMDHKRLFYAKNPVGSQRAWSGLSTSMSSYRSSAPREDFKFDPDDQQQSSSPS